MKKNLSLFILLLVTTSIWANNPKLTKESIKVLELSPESSSSDLLILYPACRVKKNIDEYSIYNNSTSYLVDKIDGFSYTNFYFREETLIHILQYQSSSNWYACSEEIPSLVQTSVYNLNKKYDRPNVRENSCEYDGYSHNKRIYTWSNESVKIELSYEWKADSYGSPVYSSLTIEYYW